MFPTADLALPPPRARIHAPRLGRYHRGLINDCLRDLRTVPMVERNALLHRFVLASGGTLIRPRDDEDPCTLGWQVTLLDVTGLGDTLTEAASDWMKCAARIVEGAR